MAVVSGDSLLTSLHAARAVGMVGRPRKGKGSRARSALVLDFDDAEEKGKGKGKLRALGWFLAPTPTVKKQQQQRQGEGRRRKHMAWYFPERVPALAAKYDLCAGGPALQAALARGGGIDQR